MSYEECPRHEGEDATNGCELCIAERVGSWSIALRAPLDGSQARYLLLRNSQVVAEFCSYELADQTRWLWTEHLTHSGAEWSEYV